MIPIGLAILSLILVNAQGVTALTSERDTGALDLLLVTELTPKEFIYGKLYGVLYNSKEMIALPVLTAIAMAIPRDAQRREPGALPDRFPAPVPFLGDARPARGDHVHQQPDGRRQQPGDDLLPDGRHPALRVPDHAQRPEVGRQLLSFMIFIGAGSVALFGSLGAKNPSRAIALVALLTPFWTFYCIISLLNGDIMAAFLVSAGIYGFALLAMLVPAVGDFDIALGRTSAIQG